MEQRKKRRDARLAVSQAQRELQRARKALAKPPVTVDDLTKHLDRLKLTSRQREFVRAAIRALLECELSERFNARVSL